VWHPLSASTHSPTHVFLSFLRPGGSISKARGGVGIDCRLQHRATSDYECNYNDVTVKEKPMRHHRAVGRARANPSIPSSSATNAHKSIPFHIFQQLSRSTTNMPHSIYTKIVCIHLPVATPSGERLYIVTEC